jgi:hypothetical protein
MKKFTILLGAFGLSIFLMGGDCGPDGEEGIECGDNVCVGAEICCNPLMSICALPDEVCTF